MHSVLKRKMNSAIGWFDNKCVSVNSNQCQIFSLTKTKSNHLHLCTRCSYHRYTYKCNNCHSKHQVEKVYECTKMDLFIAMKMFVFRYIKHKLCILICVLNAMFKYWSVHSFHGFNLDIRIFSSDTPKMRSEILKTYWAASIQYLHMWAAIVFVLYSFNFEISA